MRFNKMAARVFGVVAVAVGCLGVAATDAKASGHGGHSGNFGGMHHSGHNGNGFNPSYHGNGFNSGHHRHHSSGFWPGYGSPYYAQPRWWWKPGFGWVFSVPPAGIPPYVAPY